MGDIQLHIRRHAFRSDAYNELLRSVVRGFVLTWLCIARTGPDRVRISQASRS